MGQQLEHYSHLLSLEGSCRRQGQGMGHACKCVQRRDSRITRQEANQCLGHRRTWGCGLDRSLVFRDVHGPGDGPCSCAPPVVKKRDKTDDVGHGVEDPD